MKIITKEAGSNIKKTFNLLVFTQNAIIATLRLNGHSIMINNHLGHISTCPSNLGTALHIDVLLKVPLISKRTDFEAACHQMRLKAKKIDPESGTWEISNIDRLGYSEVTAMNFVTEGIANIIRWEEMLGEGKNIDKEVASCKPNKLIS